MRPFLAVLATVLAVAFLPGTAHASLWINAKNMKVADSNVLPHQSCELMSTSGNNQTVRCGDGHKHQDRYIDFKRSNGLHCRLKFGRIYQWYTEMERPCRQFRLNDNTINVYPE